MNSEGIPGSSILFTLNGSDVMDPYNNLNNSGASNNLLGQNEVAEAAVVLNAYSAEYGRMAGGQVNLIGKTGTNEFHGNLLYNYNDRIFNANDFFNNVSRTPRGVAISNQYGGSIGGPVWFPKLYNGKNKTFFYFDTEGLRYVTPSATTVSIPSPQFEQYTLAHIPAASVPLYQDAFNLLQQCDWHRARRAGDRRLYCIAGQKSGLPDTRIICRYTLCGRRRFRCRNFRRKRSVRAGVRDQRFATEYGVASDRARRSEDHRQAEAQLPL